MHEVFLQRSQRDLYAIRVACTGNCGPGLRKRIDTGFRVFLGSERRAIVKVSTSIPPYVPTLSINSLCKLGSASTAGFCFLLKFAQAEQFGELIEHTNLKPGEPDALAFTAESDPVEAVVPIAPSDQRQSMRTSGGGAGDGASAMLE